MTQPKGGTAVPASPAAIRHHPDAALFHRLLQERFAGPLYEQVADRLASYGFQVLSAWIHRGDIFARCASRGIRGLPDSGGWLTWSDADIDDLVQDCVVHALSKFRRDALAGRGWRSDGGASLTTYFAGTCVYSFATVYRNHHRARQRHAGTLDAVRRHPPASVEPDIAEAVAGQAAADALLATIPDPRLRMIVRLTADGHSQAEISHLLADGTTPRAVEAQLYRYRLQVRRRQR